MEENYEINTETLRNDLEEILDWLKDEIMSAPKGAVFTEQGKKGSSEFSQDVDAYEKLWKIYQTELGRDLDSTIKQAEVDRKNCEYLENVAKRTEELKLKSKELDLRDEEFEDNSRIKNRELDIKADEFKLKEDELKIREREFDIKAKEILDNIEARARELDIKEQVARESGRWWNKPIVQTGAICATTLLVNGLAIYMNGSESPLKSIYEKWMVRPKL